MPIVDVTPAHHGGYSSLQYPKAVHGGGYEYVGYVNGSSKSIMVAQYDAATDTTVTHVLDTPAAADDHNNPAVLIRADGRILVAFCIHDGPAIYTMLSTNPHDITAWGSAIDTGQTSPAGFTYPELFQLTGVSGSPIFLGFRYKGSSLTGYFALGKSTDGGATWSAGRIYGSASLLPYWSVFNDDATIHLFGMDRDPYGSQGTPNLGHMYFDGATETWHQSDGTLIGASQPFSHSQLTAIHSGLCFPIDGMMVAGKPRFTVMIDNGDGTVTARLFRWDGSAWLDSDVYTEPYNSFDRYFGGAAINRAAPGVIYAGIRSGTSTSEITRYTSTDDGATWSSGTAITTGSSVLNTGPIAIVDGQGSVPVMWLTGTYTSQSVFDFQIRALVVGAEIEGVAMGGSESGISEGYSIIQGPPRITAHYQGIAGSESGIPPGFTVSATGPTQLLMNVPGFDRPQMTTPFRGDGSPAQEGDVATWHTNRPITLEASSAAPDTTMWVPVTAYDPVLDAWLIVVDGDGNAVMVEVPL